ncbi:MAG: hypothetical protein ACSLE0_09790 [Chitinophagaceae bacterium]
MNKPINTYEELLEEQARLRSLFVAQKELVRQDINQLKLELIPVQKAIKVVEKFVTKDNTSWILSTSADTLIDMFIKRTLLSKAGFITKMVVPFFMKNFSSHVIADNKDKILSKINSWFSKKNMNGKTAHNPKESEPLTEEEED